MGIIGVETLTFEPKIDSRGSFVNIWPLNLMELSGREIVWKQINLSNNSRAGTVRGLHYQTRPFAERKLVFCIQGSILDVLLDVRTDSLTYGEIMTLELNDTNKRGVLIPEMVAHGFQTLVDDCVVLYAHTELYSQKYEGGYFALDQELQIPWKLPISVISDKDKSFPCFKKNG